MLRIAISDGFPFQRSRNARYLHDRVENVPGRSRYNGYPL
jgi:hypothetical protein